MNLFTGASHLPIIEYLDELCIILFGESKYEIYMDSGGHAEINETPIDTASREGREESLNTFNINNNNIATYVNYYDIDNLIFYKGYYAFFNKYNINIDQIFNIYNHNKNIIYSNNNVPDCWKESKYINIFSISSLINGIKNNLDYFKCMDIFSNLKYVHKRPIKYVINAIQKKIFKKINNKWITDKLQTKNVIITKNLNNEFNFLNNTYSISV